MIERALAPITEWPLSLAIERLVPPSLRDAVAKARENLGRLNGARAPGWLEGGRSGMQQGEGLAASRHLATVALADAKDRRKDHLISLASVGKIVALGRVGNVMSSQVELSADQLAAIATYDEATSVFALGWQPNETAVYGVQLIPLLAFRGFSERLSGSLLDILNDHLWGDPELEAATGETAARALADRVGALGDGNALVPITDARGALAAALNSFDLASGAIIDQETASRAVDILSARLRALFGEIKAGRVRLEGRSQPDDDIDLLPADFWRRAGARLCLASGFVFVGDADAKIGWRDLEIMAGDSIGSEAAHAANKGGRPVKEEWLKSLDGVLADALSGSPGSAVFRSAGDLAGRMARFANEKGFKVGQTPGADGKALADGWLARQLPHTRKVLVTRESEPGSRPA